MQKRTNPLELKVESKDYTPAQKETPAAQEAAVAVEARAQEVQPAPAEVTKEPEVAAQPAAKADEPVVAPVQQAAPAPAEEKKNVEEATPDKQEAPQVKKAEPLPADRVAPVRPNRPAPPRPVRHNPADDRVRHGENIADNDVSVAVKFRVVGEHVDRRMVLTKVSRDVCKLAQALYPEQSLGSIIEGALLTRAFLQDRDAFDEMAREIIKKGGKIKC